MGQMVVVPRQARRIQQKFGPRPPIGRGLFVLFVTFALPVVLYPLARKGNAMDSDENNKDDNDPREGA